MASTASRGKRIKLIAIICIVLAVLTALGTLIVRREITKRRYPLMYQEYVIKYAAEYNVPVEIVYSVIRCESGFKEKAESPVGALGLMQLMPDTYKWLCEKFFEEEFIEENITDPKTNIRCGVKYLSWLHERFENWDTVLAAYNAGQTRVYGWLGDTRYCDDGKTLKEIPVEETKTYVTRINNTIKIYKDFYGETLYSSERDE